MGTGGSVPAEHVAQGTDPGAWGCSEIWGVPTCGRMGTRPGAPREGDTGAQWGHWWGSAQERGPQELCGQQRAHGVTLGGTRRGRGGFGARGAGREAGAGRGGTSELFQEEIIIIIPAAGPSSPPPGTRRGPLVGARRGPVLGTHHRPTWGPHHVRPPRAPGESREPLSPGGSWGSWGVAAAVGLT